MAEQISNNISEETQRAIRDLEKSGMTPMELLQSKAPQKINTGNLRKRRKENGP